MPCNGWNSNGEALAEASRKAEFLEAALCGLIRSLPKHTGLVNQDRPFAEINFEEAGISKKALERWWKNHQEQDLAREVREKKARDRARLRTRAIKKLTPSERAALGVSLANRDLDEDHE